MHRISLRGPWTLAIFDDRIEASRKFHSPPGFFDSISVLPEPNIGRSKCKLFFGWKTAMAWPIDRLLLNDLPAFFPAGPAVLQPSTAMFFQYDSTSGVGTVDLAGILLRFNVVTMVWTRWPSEWQSMSGRYAPDPQHPFHFDSWLDIDE